MPEEQKPTSEVILYQTEDGRTRLEVRLENETVWLTQKLMAEWFQKDLPTINDHLRNVLEEGELAPDSVIGKFRITAADGRIYETQHYNLDVIISVGYRVKSQRGTQFRIWATQRLRDYIVKGFRFDGQPLKGPAPATLGSDGARSAVSRRRVRWFPMSPGTVRSCRQLLTRGGLVLWLLAGGLTGPLAAAEEVFLKNCAPCHGPDGRARTPVARKLGVKDLTLSKLDEAELAKTIREGRLNKAGKPAMPAFKDKLTSEEVETLIKAVQSFRTKSAK